MTSSNIFEWTKFLGSSDDDYGYGLTIGSDGSIYIAGTARGDLDGQTNNGNSDAFISKLDIYGNDNISLNENINKDSFVATDAEHHALFENINMWLPGTDDGTGGGLHTTYYDEFGTWTHYWGTWTGTGKFTGNEVTQFIHLNYGWNEEGKIFYHNVHIDGKDFLAEVNAAQAASGSE